MTNQYKETKKESQAPETENKKVRKVKSARRFLKFIGISGLFHRDNVVKALPFIFFLTVIAMIYISNAYYAERTIREIDKTTKELKELRSEDISIKSELMFRSKQSEVAREVGAMQIKESVVPPKKIIVDKKQ